MVHFGSNRIVVEFGSLIVKLPRLDMGTFIHQIQCAYFMPHNKQNVSFLFKVILKRLFGTFLKGMRNNKDEYRYCRENSTDYVAPCVYCFLGVGIHRKAVSLRIINIDEFHELTEKLFPGDHSHTIKNPDNFGKYKNKIVCRDYADLSHDEIARYVTKLREALI